MFSTLFYRQNSYFRSGYFTKNGFVLFFLLFNLLDSIRIKRALCQDPFSEEHLVIKSKLGMGQCRTHVSFGRNDYLFERKCYRVNTAFRI